MCTAATALQIAIHIGEIAKAESDVGALLSHGIILLENQDDQDLRDEIVQTLLQCAETEVEVLE